MLRRCGPVWVIRLSRRAQQQGEFGMEIVLAPGAAFFKGCSTVDGARNEIRLVSRQQRLNGRASAGGKDEQRMARREGCQVHRQRRQSVVGLEGDQAAGAAKRRRHLLDSAGQLGVAHCVCSEVYCGPVSKRCQMGGKGDSGQIRLNTHQGKIEGMPNLTQMDLRAVPKCEALEQPGKGEGK